MRAQPQEAASGARHGARPPMVAVIGNPNTGKSTLFNLLTGLRQKVGNYPGVTVEKHHGSLDLEGREAHLVDLPGTYSLAAHSPDEMVAADLLAGRYPELGHPDAVIVVADASNLRRNLFLVSQVIELGIPTVVALNMMDLAAYRGMEVDVRALEEALHARVVPLAASKGVGIDALRAALGKVLDHGRAPGIRVGPALDAELAQLEAWVVGQGHQVPRYVLERALLDEEGYAEHRLAEQLGEGFRNLLARLRDTLGRGQHLSAVEARERYAWINALVDRVETRRPAATNWSERVDRVLGHPVLGITFFLFLMATVFQAVFAWATPLMDAIDTATAGIGQAIHSALPAGALASLLGDGVVAGVGSVLVFLPQILILFTFIILLEDSGYMARAAFLMDRVMRGFGLSGQSFIPMLSSFACAVPGILATRVIPDRRDRFATILAAPFMTCSARLPVYALLIAAFVPDRDYLYGLLNLQGLVLLGLYLLGMAGGVLTALLLKRSVLRGAPPTFLMEMPPYRLPNVRAVLLRLWERARVFLKRAGTVIFTVAVVVWALAYFPRASAVGAAYDAQRLGAMTTLSSAALEARLAELDHREAAAYLEDSYLGRMGKAIEPVFRPLGWDWKVSAAVIASFPAREVVIAVLGTVYAVGSEVEAEDEGLLARVRASAWPDGRPVFSLPMAVGLMVFYAFCLQCVATVATIRRETNGWRWALGAWVYMTGLGYLGALLAFQLGRAL